MRFGMRCSCYICKNNISEEDLGEESKFAKRTLKRLAEQKLTANEIVKELTANWNQIEKIHENHTSKELHMLMAANNKYVEWLSLKKSYVSKSGCCYKPCCAADQIKI
jgi:hypothetical protein